MNKQVSADTAKSLEGRTHTLLNQGTVTLNTISRKDGTQIYWESCERRGGLRIARYRTRG